MIPLIDADILLYEIGFGCVTGWKAIKEWKEGDAPLDPPPWDYVAELVDNRIADICGKVMATKPPKLYLTGKGNFREAIAKKAKYKGNRIAEKPFHYENIKAYLINKYDAEIINGMEADDAICIEQTKNLSYAEGNPFWSGTETIICTRDKDLRQCEGWHYGWELGNQPEFGPEFVKGLGYIKLSIDCKKLSGVGEKFFFSQLLTGDATDNIPGLPKFGPKKAFDLLINTQTREEAFKAIVEAYKGFYGDSWREELLEQGQLLYMLREEGKMWSIPDDV